MIKQCYKYRNGQIEGISCRQYK